MRSQVAASSLSPERLVRLCVETGDTAAWEEFVRRFRPVIAGTVARTARRFGETSPQVVDDLIQDTYLKICADRCRILREFESRGPDAIFGLLKTVAFSVTHDYFRGQLSARRDRRKTAQPLDSGVESAVEGRESLPPAEREILLTQIDDYLRSHPHTSERDRSIFWLYYRRGMTSREIVAIPCIGLAQKGVESVIQRLTSQVRNWLVDGALEPKGAATAARPEGNQPAGSF